MACSLRPRKVLRGSVRQAAPQLCPADTPPLVSLVVSAVGAAPHGARKVPRPAPLPARLRPPPPRAVVARPWAARPLGGGQLPALPARPAGGGCAPRGPLSAALRRHPRRPFLRPSVGPSAPPSWGRAVPLRGAGAAGVGGSLRSPPTDPTIVIRWAALLLCARTGFALLSL